MAAYGRGEPHDVYDTMSAFPQLRVVLVGAHYNHHATSGRC